MTPQETAKELLDRYTKIVYHTSKVGIPLPYESDVIECALLCVEECLELAKANDTNTKFPASMFGGETFESYWTEVKNCIEAF